MVKKENPRQACVHTAWLEDYMKKCKQIASTALKILIPIAIFVVVILNFDRLKNLDVGAIVAAAPSVWAAYAIVLGI